MRRGLFTHASIRMVAGLVVAGLAVALTAAAAVAADPPATPPATTPELDSPAPRPQGGVGTSTQSGMPGCAVWTDRCIICQRDGGVVACSNIGTACQPQAMLCVRPEATEEKKPEK